MVNVINISFEEIISYKFPLNKFFKLIISSKSNKYTFLSFFKDTNKLLCLNKNQLENKIGKNKNLNEINHYFKDFSLLIYDCPISNFRNVQSEDNNFNHLIEIKNIIEQISHNREIANSNIFFFGNNENSFFPLIFGYLLRDSKIIVENPTFNLKKNTIFKNDMISLINKSYHLFNSMNKIINSGKSKNDLLENYIDGSVNEIKCDLKKLNENHEKFLDLFNKNYVLKNELLLEKNKLSVELEYEKRNLLKIQEENETLKEEINKQNDTIKMLNNQINDIFNAENKLRGEVSLLKNQNYELKQELLKEEKEKNFLNNEMCKIKEDELNRLKLIKQGINNE